MTKAHVKQKLIRQKHEALKKLGIEPPKDYAENKRRLDACSDRSTTVHIKDKV